MITLYKYLPREYAKRLVQHGELLIRNLESFRDESVWDSKRGDAREGAVKFLPDGKVFDTSDPSHNKSIAHAISGNIQAGRIRIEVEKELNITTQHAFIYSMSKKYDPKLFEEFQCDSCVEIIDYQSFYNKLTDHLIHDRKLNVSETVTKECLYLDKNFDMSQELPDTPVFLKNKKYQSQGEVRGVWVITNCGDDNIIVKFPELSKYCSLVNIN